MKTKFMNSKQQLQNLNNKIKISNLKRLFLLNNIF